jgi:hypothetical protein
VGDMVENQVLNKLVDSFDDFKERLIRIEERLKNIDDMKNDVDNLKIGQAQTDASAKSAHKRLDVLEANQTWLWRTVIGAIIVGSLGVLFAALKGGA